MDKKEPISDLTQHNIRREEDVKSATKRLDEYLVQTFDLMKSGFGNPVNETQAKSAQKKPASLKSGDKEMGKGNEGISDKNAEANKDTKK